MNRIYAAVSACVVLASTGTAFGQGAKDMHDEVEQTTKAATVFREIMSAPDKAIPQSVLDDADCIAVFPSVVKAAFGVGGQGGRGVAICRTATGWSSPAYLNLGGGSFGFQIGVAATDYVMLFMTPAGAKSLIESNVKLGAGASVAAGPVGRDAGAATDAKMNAQILSYSRAKGLFAGAALEGAVIETADKDMTNVYGPNVSSKTVLFDGGVKAPQDVMAFAKTVAGFTPAAGKP